MSLVTERDLAHGCGALASASETIRTAPKGTRNKTFSGQVIGIYELVANGSIPEQEADETVWSAIEQSGYFADKSEAEAKESLKTAKSKGLAQPRPLLAEASASSLLDVARQSVQNMIAAYKRKQGKATTPALSKRSITLLQCSTIQAKPITWLWKGYLPSGKLTLLAGAGGTGKSTIAFSFAGIVSNGGVWPDNSHCNIAGNVLIWSSEDDAADTILPRLMAVGANLSRCGIISGAVDEDGLRCPFDAASDMGRLRDAILQIGGISLLIVDPIVTAVTGDMHKANDVRRSLQAIVDFASEMNCAVLGITHFAKGTAGKNSAERVIGSQAFAALARMVLVTAKEEDSQNRVFTRAKSNNGIDTGGFSYTIEALTLAGGIVTTRALWGESLEGSSRSILSEIEGDSADEGSSKLNQAKAFLLDKLKNGFMPQKELFEHAREIQGITDGTMRRAGKALSIVPRKLAMNGGWVWELPITINAR
jgi:putative DNA primase/helicase